MRKAVTPTDHTSKAVISLYANAEASTEDIGRELQRIAKTNRNAAYTAIGSYMGLTLLVKAEYNLAQIFDHNSFYVEGLDGMKYRYGMTGALPLAFADKVRYPAMTLQRLPSIIESQKSKSARLEDELPVLREIIGRSWSKTEELARLRTECESLRRKIENDLQEVGQCKEDTATVAAA